MSLTIGGWHDRRWMNPTATNVKSAGRIPSASRRLLQWHLLITDDWLLLTIFG